MKMLIDRVVRALASRKLDCLLVSDQANISYLTGFKSRDAWLLVTPEQNIYFTDGRYTEEASKALKGITLHKINKTASEEIASVCKKKGLQKIGFEEHYVSWLFHSKLSEKLPKGAHLAPAGTIIEDFRKIKSARELLLIRKAVSIACAAMEFAATQLLPGKREIEIAAEIERFIRIRGASASSFEIIVASGPHTSRPHHATSSRRLRLGEPVIIDLGAEYLGYKSDLTRTFFLGKITPLFKKVYTIVIEAQKRAFAAIRPQVFVNTVDACARQIISKKGYGGFFNHSLGHGVGLEVHEAPHVSQKNQNELLKQGMVFTVEPGIYLPGRFGVRIEDMIVVTRKGCEVLSGSLNK